VLIGLAEDTSRYDASMAEAYLTHRPFPRPLAEHMIREGDIGSDSAVLDLASGPGSLALELAKASSDVTIMELSRGFLDAACARAEASGVRLTAIHESCNRLVHHDQSYDVITVSQALHWLDDVMVCKGVCRLLRSHGSFFVVHGALTLRDDHPLSYILGDRTPLGDKAPGAFAAEAAALARRTSLLFAALDAPDVQRVDPTHRGGACAERIRLAGVRMFRQRRPIGEGFARAFLAPAHVAALGMSAEAFWADLAARCAAADDTQTLGVQDWAVLHFRRGGRTEPTQGRDADEVAEIGWDG
jgi:SAM-dependent methyltransferase